jgi:phage repressor protein C with HTH and peptisase S24 domain
MIRIINSEADFAQSAELSVMKKLIQTTLSQTKPKADISYRAAFAQRLKHAAENHDIAELAAKIRVTPVTLYRWISGQFDPSLPKLAEFAAATGISLCWLVTGRGPLEERQAMRHALLEQYDTIEFEPGGDKACKAPLAFYEPWLFELIYGSREEPKRLGAAATMEPLLLMQVGEDSMEPTIAQGDLLLIDRSFGLTATDQRQAQREGRSPFDGIYAFQPLALSSDADGTTGQPLVRRIQYRLDGTVIVRCDNPRYSEEVYRPDARNAPRYLGRVVWRGGLI